MLIKENGVNMADLFMSTDLLMANLIRLYCKGKVTEKERRRKRNGRKRYEKHLRKKKMEEKK